MNILKKVNKRSISLILCFLTISAYIVLGNCLTFNIGERMPIKIAEIIALISGIVLLIIHKKDSIKLNLDNIKILIWFAIAAIPIIIFNYTLKQRAYGLLYSIRIIATLFIALVIANTFKKYEISRDNICHFIIYNYLVVVFIGIMQLIFFPIAYDFYEIFYKIGVYFANPDPHMGRLISTYFDPNFLAACLIIPTILSLNYFSKTGKYRYLIYVVIFITVIVLTVSRSGILGICIALFVYAICTIKIKNKRMCINIITVRAFIVLILTVLIFAFLTFCTNVRVFKRILGTYDDESTYMRFDDWNKGLKTVSGEEEEEDDVNNNTKSNLIIGIGYNMLGFSSANAGKASSASFGNDSSLLVVLISSGIIGSLYFVYMIGSRVIVAFKERKNYTDNEAIIAIIITSIVICNFNNLLFYTLWLFPIFLIINLKKETHFSFFRDQREEQKDGKKRIGIDGRALTDKRAGIGNYTYENIKKLNEIDTKNEYFIYSNKSIILDFNLNKNWHICEHKFRVGTIWQYYILPKILKKDEIDVFWGTQHVLPKRTKYTKDIKYIVTIHDLAIFKLKGIGSYYNTIIQNIFVEESLNCADKIIAISESTKKDIIELFDIPEEKIVMIYNGANFENTDLTEKAEIKILKNFKILKEEYMLFISTIEPRKNLNTLIKAFEVIKNENDKLKLVICGGLGWKYKKTLQLINNSKYSNDIFMLGYISKEEKQCLLKNSKCFIYPSLYEGFGLPILEAMINHTIVVTSNSSSLPEIGGEAVYYYDDLKSFNNLADVIQVALEVDESKKEEKIKKGIKQLEKFNWEQCSRNVLKLLNE